MAVFPIVRDPLPDVDLSGPKLARCAVAVTRGSLDAEAAIPSE